MKFDFCVKILAWICAAPSSSSKRTSSLSRALISSDSHLTSCTEWYANHQSVYTCEMCIEMKSKVCTDLKHSLRFLQHHPSPNLHHHLEHFLRQPPRQMHSGIHNSPVVYNCMMCMEMKSSACMCWLKGVHLYSCNTIFIPRTSSPSRAFPLTAPLSVVSRDI